MNIKNLLKTSILAYAVVFSINNNANAYNENNIDYYDYDDEDDIGISFSVEKGIFQHKVSIQNKEMMYFYEVPHRKIYVEDNNTQCMIPFRKADTDTKYEKQKYQTYNEYECVIQNCGFVGYYDNENQISIDTQNKFKELHNKLKGTNGTYEDAKTSFDKAVREVFDNNNDYKVIKNTEEDFSEILAKYPGNCINKAKIEDGTRKDLIKVFKARHFNQYYFKELDSLLKQNGFQLTTKFSGCSWCKEEGIVVKNKNSEKKLLKMDDKFLKYTLGMKNIIITNGCNVIVFDPICGIINIYRRNGCYTKLKSGKSLVNKLNRVGLVLQEAYEKESKIVKEVFGQDFYLKYDE